MNIKANATWYRPLSHKGKSINNILFYKDNEIIYQSNRGWLEDGSCDIRSININEPKKVNKINLNRKDNFYITNRDKYTSEVKYDLYIFVDGIDIIISDKKEILGIQTSLEINYQYQYDLVIPCTVKTPRLDDNDELEYFDKEKDSIKVTGHYHRQEFTKLGLKVNNTLTKLKKAGFDKYSRYDIEKLLKAGFKLVKTNKNIS